MEAGLARVGNAWVISARQREKRGIAWLRASDPFAETPAPIFPEAPQCNSPLTAFVCGDGVLRAFTGDATQSPHRNARDPCTVGTSTSRRASPGTNRHEIFDSVKTGLPIRKEVVPKIDFCELFPRRTTARSWSSTGVSTRGYTSPIEIVMISGDQRHRESGRRRVLLADHLPRPRPRRAGSFSEDFHDLASPLRVILLVRHGRLRLCIKRSRPAQPLAIVPEFINAAFVDV